MRVSHGLLLPMTTSLSAPASSARYGAPFWMLCASSFLFFMSFNMLIPELPALLTRLGGADHKGLIIALFTLTAGLSRPFSGVLADRVGRLPVMVLGAVVSGACALCYPFLGSVWAFLLLRLLHGFSTGFTPTGQGAYMSDIIPEQTRGKALGLLSFFGSSGTGLGPALGSFLAARYGMDVLFYVSAAVAFASVFIVWGMQETLSSPEPFSPGMLRLKPRQLALASVWPAALCLALFSVMYGVMLTLVPDQSVLLGLSNKGTFYLFFTLATVAARLLAGSSSDRYGRVPVLQVAALVVAAGLAMAALATQVWVFFGAALLLGFGVGLYYPAVTAWTVDLSPLAFRGRGLATLYLAMEAGIGAGALLAGQLYANNPDRIGWPFAVACALSMAAFLFLFTQHRTARAS